eukprot:1827129-Amphidinium_carterae.1
MAKLGRSNDRVHAISSREDLQGILVRRIQCQKQQQAYASLLNCVTDASLARAASSAAALYFQQPRTPA